MANAQIAMEIELFRVGDAVNPWNGAIGDKLKLNNNVNNLKAIRRCKVTPGMKRSATHQVSRSMHVYHCAFFPYYRVYYQRSARYARCSKPERAPVSSGCILLKTSMRKEEISDPNKCVIKSLSMP